MRNPVILVLALAALAAGCSGGDGEGTTSVADTAPTVPAETEPQTRGAADPAPGRALLRFVRAAADGDAETMWRLLNEPTKASVGPTLGDFRGSALGEFKLGLGSLAPTAKVVLSERVGDRWGVAAVAGERRAGAERGYFAYAAALTQEDGAWKLELGGVIVSAFKPPPLATTSATPKLGASIGAGGDLDQLLLWLDGRPLDTVRGGQTAFAATLAATPERPLAPGRHVLVAFGATSETASASAWTFTVRG